MPRWPEQALGACLILVVLLDVFLTVLYARIGTGVISDRLARLIWRLLLGLAKLSGPRNSATVLSFCGPVILVLLVLAWALGLTVGAALVMHPDLGTSIRASGGGDTPTDFVAALYAGGSSMAFVGASDFTPHTAAARLLFLFNSLVGASVISLTLSYLVQVYAALQQRNTLGLVERHQAQIREAARLRAPPGSMPPAPAAAPPSASRSDRRRARFEAVARLRAEGATIKEIARRTGTARNAVRRWLRAGEFVPYRRAPAPGLLDPHLPFAEERWLAGLRNSVELHRELGARGFKGGYDVVRRWAARRRRGQPRPAACPVPSTRQTARLLAADPASLSTDDRGFLDTLLASAPAIRAAAEHVRAFADLVRRREPATLDTWLETAADAGLGGFAAGLRQDRAAVRAAVAEPWSNGPVEGHINRLKLVKRQMFGRAGFDLLRQRVPHAT